MSLLGFSGSSMVKNPPTIQEMRVQPLGWEDPLEKEMASYSSILAWEILWTEGAWQAIVPAVAKELDATEPLNDNKMSLLAIMIKHTVHKSARVDCSPHTRGKTKEPIICKAKQNINKSFKPKEHFTKKKNQKKKQKNTSQNKNKSKNNQRSKKNKTLEQSHKKQVALKLDKVQFHESLPHEERLPLRKSSSVGRNVFLNLWRVSLAK